MDKIAILLNSILIVLGIFTLIAMSAVIGVFEEFTAFTDYTQQWIEFNFFIFYWDKLTITRTYLSFLFIYGALIIAGKCRSHTHHTLVILFIFLIIIEQLLRIKYMVTEKEILQYYILRRKYY